MTEQSQHLYQQALLAHHKKPTGFNEDINANYQRDGFNSACGDEITLSIRLNNGMIEQGAFSGESCAICRASASILCQQLDQVSITNYRKLSAQLRYSLLGKQDFPLAFLPLSPVAKLPVRQQCALLAWQTLDNLLASTQEYV